MHIRDEIARIKLESVREDIRNGNEYTKPYLGLDVEAYRAYRERETEVLPKKYCDCAMNRMMMSNVQGMKILCLAGGGGQQSAVFSLLGAEVTVLDLCPEQLESDQKAARHYGYEVTTIQGDMRDLSVFDTAAFDRVYQPISTLFIPDLRELYAGVARVLAPGGLYFTDYAVPLIYMARISEWDGEGYTLRVTAPYIRGAILETEDERMNFTEGRSFSEFHHLLSDIINGHIAEGFNIRGVWENPRPDSGPPLHELEPGSDEHRQRFIPMGLSVVAEGTGPMRT